MTTFHIFTIFPESLDSYFNSSILKRAQEKKLIKIKIHDIRKFTKDKHKKADDRPFGGGAGMVMKAEPIARAIDSIFKQAIDNLKHKILIILLTPGGKQFEQKMAINMFKKYTDIAIICGRYEGIDARLGKVLQAASYKLQEISVGPYILMGGELPAMIIADAVSRHIPGVLGKESSLEEKKGSYPVYTRPEVIGYGGKKYKVPKVLMSGDHKKIEEWRRKHSKFATRN